MVKEATNEKILGLLLQIVQQTQSDTKRILQLVEQLCQELEGPDSEEEGADSDENGATQPIELE